MLRRTCLVTVTITGHQMKASLWMVNALNSMGFLFTMTMELLELKKTIKQNTVVWNKWRIWVWTLSVQLTTQLVSRLCRLLLSLVCWSKKKPSILGMVVRNSMTTVASLTKMLLTQTLKKVKNGLILTFVPWLNEERTTLLSLCGLSVMKSVKQTENLVL